MQNLEVSGAVRPIYGSLGVKRLMHKFFFYNKFIICLYMFRALLCSKHVEEYNKLIIREEFVIRLVNY